MKADHSFPEAERRVENGVARGTAVQILLDGKPLSAFTGESVAAALLAAGRRVLRTTARYDAPRGLYCGMGTCFECVMTIDGRPNVRICQTAVRDGMRVETQSGDGRWAVDIESTSSPHSGGPSKVPLLVIGGGPAGMAAAIEASRAGLACTLVDEAPRLGGQIYRQQPEAFHGPNSRRPGRDIENGRALIAEFAAERGRIDVRPSTAVVGIWGADAVWSSGVSSGTFTAERMIIATGAYDRPVPFPGWTLPGVMTAGGAQALVKTMHVRPGRRALVAGTGPLLLVVANQLHKAGVEVTAVLEAGAPSWSFRALRHALSEPALLKDAWNYWRGLRRAGIPIRFNHTIFEAHGSREVESVTWGPVNPETWRPIRELAQETEVDLAVVGFGFVPNVELTELAGCRHEYVHDVGGWVPVRSACMETTVPGVFAAGDGAGVAGALVAIEEGRIAGITAAEQAGVLGPAEADRRRSPSIDRLRSLSRVRGVLDAMSRIRPGLSELARPETLVCRCEEVSAAEVGRALEHGARDLQAIKLLTRLGMGPCQGRNCGPSVGLYAGFRLGCGPEDAGRVNPRPPIKPVTVGALAGSNAHGSKLVPAARAHGDP